MDRVRILVADHHEIVRLGVRSILRSEPGWEVCGEAANAQQLVERVDDLKPDVVVTELVMPGVSVLEAVRELLRRAPDQKILALTHCDSEALAQGALQSGVRGLLLKSDTGIELRTAIDVITNGGVYFARHISAMLLEGFLRGEGFPPADAPFSGILTARENEILAAIACGMPNREISKAFSVTTKTVESHRTNIMRKLELHSVAELVLYAIRNNIIPVDNQPTGLRLVPEKADISAAPDVIDSPTDNRRVPHDLSTASAATASASVA